MKTALSILAFFASTVPVLAETVVAARTIRAHSVLTADDIGLAAGEVPGALKALGEAVGLEAKVMIYAGRPVRASDLGPPAIIERNQIVTLRFQRGGLTIATEGRAMSRAGIGDTVRAVNLASRLSVSGLVASDGSVRVTGSER